jgi:hypothetical protein
VGPPASRATTAVDLADLAIGQALREWQSYQITARGPHLEVKVNGELITVADGLADQTGYIGIQGEGGQLEFKGIRIRVLPATKTDR